MSVNPSGTLNFKVVLLGEGCVGKTSILLRFIEDKFNERHMSTLQTEGIGVRLLYSNSDAEPKRLPSRSTPRHAYPPLVDQPLSLASSSESIFEDAPDVPNYGLLVFSMDLATFMNKRLNISDKRVNLSIWDTAGQEKFHALGPIYYRNSNGAILVYDITDEESFEKVRNWVKELKKMLGPGLVLAIAGNKVDRESERTVNLEEAEAYAKAVGATHYSTSAKKNIAVEELFVDMARELVERLAKRTPEEMDGGRVLVVDDEPQAPAGCCAGLRHAN